MSIKALTIHGHFYQPPREDPITGLIHREVNAKPYKNWNERIHAECYFPNTQLRNFEHISFNVGPTLFSWLAENEPLTYQSILDQDHANVSRYGVGNAIAQSYNHTILPLSTSADKITQIAWGIADFNHRFGRSPQGMWLPETAVDIETLIILADRGIQFTILAPWQASSEAIDPTQPYRVNLPAGRSITIFFYQTDLSSRISFDPSATANADLFAVNELSRYFRTEESRNEVPKLVMIASDGELYGHHQPFREKFLAHLLNGASSRAGLVPTYPGLWLKQFPPQQEIEIREFTSWSCHHGVARWKENCDCITSDGSWKFHLRRSLDQLANALDWVYFDNAYPFIGKPRGLREQYIQVILGNITVDRLIHEMADHPLTNDHLARLKLLLRAQYERQRMFTSCGWFFEDFDRIEPKNNLAYAAQAVWLTKQATGEDLSSVVLSDLSKVASQKTKLRGDQVFKNYLTRAAEHKLDPKPKI